MLSLVDFKNKDYNQKYDFLQEFIFKLEDKYIFSDFKDFFRVVKKPTELVLDNIFELLEQLLFICNEKDENKKQERILKIAKALEKVYEEESSERNYDKSELEKVLKGLE